MNTAVIESHMESLKGECQSLEEALKALPEDLQTTILRLIAHCEAETAQAFEFNTQYRELKRREQFLKTFTDIPEDAPWVMGKYYDWPQFWLDRLAGIPQKNLAYLPYKQCHWCGQGVARPKGKSFCSDDHANEFRHWRDNARRVGKKKSLSERDHYYLKQVAELYAQNQPPTLYSVVYVAYHMAHNWFRKTIKPFVPEADLDNLLSVTPRVHHIVRKLLKHYQQRRVLKIGDNLSHYLNINPQDVTKLMTPAAFMTDEYLMLK
jgi:hypothetical protein